MSFSVRQQRSLAIVPKATGALSIIGALVIVADILRNETKRKQTYSRLVLGMVGGSILPSLMFFLSTWPIPSETGLYGASGTTQSCTLQGFFIQTYTIYPLTNFFLSIYYLLVITFKWSEFRIKKIEKWMLIGPLVFGLGTAIAGLPLTLYNNASLWCWISSLPQTCSNARSSSGKCIRGDNAWLYRWLFMYVPSWFCIVCSTFAMAVVSWTVWAGEKKSRKYRSSRSSQSRKDKLTRLSRQVAWQAFLYMGAFYISLMPSTVLRCRQTMKKDIPFIIPLLVVIFLPLHGFLNALVYIRPRYDRFLQKNPHSSVPRAAVHVVRMTFAILCKTTNETTTCVDQHDSDENTDASGDELYDKDLDAQVTNPVHQLQTIGRYGIDDDNGNDEDVESQQKESAPSGSTGEKENIDEAK